MSKVVQKPVRNLRLKEGKEKIKESKRSIEDLVSKNVDPVEMAKTLTDNEVYALVDEAQHYDETMKDAKKKLEPMKVLLLENAKFKEWKTKAGEKAICTIKPSTSTTVVPLELLRKITELGKKKLFDSLFKVKITEAKEYLGKEELESISKVDTKKYGSVGLKKQ
jgi:hypothetical protein